MPLPGARQPRHESPWRWLLLALAVAIILGPYEAFDAPAATQSALRGRFGGPASVDANSSATDAAMYADFSLRFQLLYTAYSLPNTVLPAAGGVLVDVVGVRTVLLASSVVALVGQTIVTAGLFAGDWATMWAGRAVFGVGTEALCVAQRILLSRFFRAELALAMGLTLAFGRFGSVMCDLIGARYDAPRVLSAYCVSSLCCVLSFAATVAAVALDRSFDDDGNGVTDAVGSGGGTITLPRWLLRWRGGRSADASEVAAKEEVVVDWAADVDGGDGGSDDNEDESARLLTAALEHDATVVAARANTYSLTAGRAHSRGRAPSAALESATSAATDPLAVSGGSSSGSCCGEQLLLLAIDSTPATDGPLHRTGS
jgi:hypothetical protein